MTGQGAGGGDDVVVEVLNSDIIRAHRLSTAVIGQVVRREQEELARRERRYRKERPFPSLAGRVVVLADDGLATGATMRAALTMVRQQQPAWLVVAAPVGDHEACMALRGEADAVVCVWEPEPLQSVAAWYGEFTPTSEAELQWLLDRMQARA